MNETEKRDMLMAAFNALPSLVLVVDEDVRIQDYNTAASELLMAERKTVLKRRAGEILHCIHSTDVPEGCGNAPSCKNCVVRNSVMEAFQGKRVVRHRARIELLREEKKIEIYALISAAPFSFQDRPLVLLVIEDISEIAELYRMIPICSVCRKVRDDKESWMALESYFKNNWDVDFTHGLCPDCYAIEREKLKSFIKNAQDSPEDTGKPRNKG
jgi:hypothetical protein